MSTKRLMAIPIDKPKRVNKEKPLCSRMFLKKVFMKLSMRMIGDYMSVKELNDATRLLRFLHRIGKQNQGCTRLVDGRERLHHRRPSGRIKIAGGLIDQQERWLKHSGPRKRRHLLLQTTQLTRETPANVSQSETPQSLLYPLASFAALHFQIQERQRYVLGHAELVHQIELTKHVSDVPPAQGQTICFPQAGHFFSAKNDAAGIRSFKQAQDVEQGGLSAA